MADTIASTNTGGTAALPTSQSGDLVKNITSLLQLLGGTKTTETTNPGDTAALQNVLGQLQGADYNAMLQTIFQQAGGQIPGLQQGLSNAIGARSGSNSAVQAALQKLLQQTTVAAQDQMAKQQLANQQAQIQAGQAVANATKGTQTTKQSGTNLKAGVGNLAKGTALLQLLSAATKATGSNTIQDAVQKMGGMFGMTSAPAAGGFMGPLQQQDMPALNLGDGAQISAPQMAFPALSSGAPGINMNDILSNAPQASQAVDQMPTFNIADYLGNAPAPAPEMSMAPDEWFAPEFNINDYLM